jgi:hypothetical protein
MAELSKTNSNNLPGALPDDYAEKLMAGVAAARSSMPSSGGGGVDILKMDREGNWNYGLSNEEVQPGSRWVFNPTMFAHGWVCWVQPTPGVKGRKAGEVMRSMLDPMPPEPPLAEGKYPWVKQYGCTLKCLDGVDAGHEVVFKGSSGGGQEGMTNLIDAFQRNFVADRAHPCPVVTLDTTSYPNKTYGGQTYKPVFTVVGWADMNGVLAGDPPEALESPLGDEAPAAAPIRTRTRKPPLAAAAAAPQQEPLPTQRVHAADTPAQPARVFTGQRRRPAAS